MSSGFLFAATLVGLGGAVPPAVASQVQQAPADLWVMGLEVNQGFQDVLYTHIRASGPGVRTVNRTDAGPSSPVIPAKPTIVRVYVGLRAGPQPVGSVAATGRLIVNTNDGSAPVTLFAVQSAAGGTRCEERSAAFVTACRSVIQVFRSLGRQGLQTNHDYDLDLIDARARWDGTLNFVLPASLTAGLRQSGRLTLHALVQPVGTTEAQPPDNQFQLEHRNVAEPGPLNVRLVRVAYKTTPAPSSTAAQRAVENMLRLLPYNRVNFLSDREYGWDGVRVRLGFRVKVGPFKFRVSFHKYTQCESLWIRVYREFRSTQNVLFALYPNSVSLQGCTGIGGKVSGSVLNPRGAIAASKMPSSEAANTNGDRDKLAIMSQELYHAVFRRPHVSNNHGEAKGCPLHGSFVLLLIRELRLGKFDCFKRSPYPHGALGAYPEDPGNRLISGERGGFALDIRSAGTNWDLVLHDPCPTGSIRANPVAAISTRWDTTARAYRCTLSDTARVPHDFMSYGDNRWTSRAQFFGGPRLVAIPTTG